MEIFFLNTAGRMGSIVQGVFRSHGMIVFAHIPALLACFSRKAFNTASGFEPD